MNRWPSVILLIAILTGMAWADRVGDDPAVAEPASIGTELSAASSVAPAADTAESTWYCTGGFTTPDGVNDHLVTILNDGAEPATGTLTLYPALLDTLGSPVGFERAVQPLLIEAHTSQTLSLAPIVASLNPLLSTETGSFVGALVELAGSGIRVEHTLDTPVGQGRSACTTTAATSWWFASGTTTTDVTDQLYLLNPFPDDAVVDISFVTDGGVREPTSLDGRLVPAQGLTMIDLTPIVPVWPQVAAKIMTRTGRVIAERVQIFASPDGPRGLSLSAGTPRLAEQWFFPAAGSVTGAAESYVIYNPNDITTEVEFELKLDSADRAGDIAPLPFTLGPNERWVVNVSLHPTHPSETVATIDATRLARPGERYFVSVRSFSGGPIAVERLLTRPGDSGHGVAQSFGITVASTDQVLAVPESVSEALIEQGENRLGELSVLNPAGNTIARVEVWVGGNGEPALLRRQVELAPRRRAAFDLDTLLGVEDRWVRVLSSSGTMAELVVALPNEMTTTAAVPRAGTLSIPDLFAFE